MKEKGVLYVVATPIGNLEDITLRALRILKESDLILCESTTNSQKLLNHYDIKNKISVFYGNSKISHLNNILKLLSEGKKISLITDSGTPCISDPGVLIIQEIIDKKLDIDIIPIPGVSALTTAFSISGLSGNAFVFLGYVPTKKGRETFFKNLTNFSNYPVIFYESVHRLEKCLNSLEKVLDTNDEVIIMRELTKKFESVIRGTASSLKNFFSQNPDQFRGEFVIIVNRYKK